jgi:hypothetical protein
VRARHAGSADNPDLQQAGGGKSVDQTGRALQSRLRVEEINERLFEPVDREIIHIIRSV